MLRRTTFSLLALGVGMLSALSACQTAPPLHPGPVAKVVEIQGGVISGL